MKRDYSHKIIGIPNQRIGTIDIGVASKRKHHISALVEFDVTDARTLLKAPEHKTVSFTAWIIKCISHAIEENRQVQGIRYKRRKILIFDDIDVSMMIEREMNGEKIPFPYVIRNTQTKTVHDISFEIRQAQYQEVSEKEDFVLGEKKNARLMNLYAKLPAWMRNFMWKVILKNPYTIKENMGTVMVTSVGMMGKIHGWIIPKSVHPVSFAVGSIVKKPMVHRGEIEIREQLFITVTIDHDVLDGAPAMRILNKLGKLLESGYGLSKTSEI